MRISQYSALTAKLIALGLAWGCTDRPEFGSPMSSTGGTSPTGVTGGVSTGGVSTGGVSTGGVSAGGLSTGGVSTGGVSAGGAGASGVGSVRKLGESCAPEGGHACAGYGQQAQLTCSGGIWVASGSCAQGAICDTREGANVGLCATITAECTAKKAGAAFCQDKVKVACGADLLSVEQVEVCPEACVLGACTACEPNKTRCSGNEVQTCDMNGAWGAGKACAEETPMCSGAGVCGLPPSCAGLAATCGGASGNVNCCVSKVLPGGTFNRDNNPNYPAMVSDFRLDKYEVTVGRFRKFVAAYTPNMIPAGKGNNVNNPADPGWNMDWNVNLPADKAALQQLLSGGSWTDQALGNENLPIIFVSWYEAQAFCTWDGGRLPTDLEWNYAAAGGSGVDGQRKYPWGPTDPTPDTQYAVYGCFYNYNGACNGGSVANLAPVGSAASGNGRWGHSDLAGNAIEWIQDWNAISYPASCDNCANLVKATSRVARGGSYSDPSTALDSTKHTMLAPSSHFFGIRCARAR